MAIEETGYVCYAYRDSGSYACGCIFGFCGYFLHMDNGKAVEVKLGGD